MKMDEFKQLSPFEQAVILLLEAIASDIRTIRKYGED